MKALKIQYKKIPNEKSSEWELLFRKSLSTSFLSPSWHKIVLSLYTRSHLTHRLNRIQYFTACRQDDPSSLSIAGFFFIQKSKGKTVLKFTQLLGPSDYYDFLHTPDFDASVLPELLRKIAFQYKANLLSFSHIREDSLICKALSDVEDIEKKSLKCVAINLPEDYDTWFKSLSKSVRQNIRTANNRVKKAGLSMEAEFLKKEDAEKINFKALKEIYRLRSAGKKQKVYWKTKVYKFLDWGFKGEPDMFDLEEIKETDFTLGILKLDGRIAAYFFGLNQSDRIEINRVAIHPGFYFYSPGMILLSEYIKTAIPQGLKILDLTVGDEKYKYDLGGETHNIWNFKWKPL